MAKKKARGRQLRGRQLMTPDPTPGPSGTPDLSGIGTPGPSGTPDLSGIGTPGPSGTQKNPDSTRNHVWFDGPNKKPKDNKYHVMDVEYVFELYITK